MLERQIWQQPVAVPFAHNWAHQRQPCPQLVTLTDTDREAGLDDLPAELEALDLDHLQLLQLVSRMARRDALLCRPSDELPLVLFLIPKIGALGPRPQASDPTVGLSCRRVF
jgi:hypothetical protein